MAQSICSWCVSGNIMFSSGHLWIASTTSQALVTTSSSPTLHHELLLCQMGLHQKNWAIRNGSPLAFLTSVRKTLFNNIQQSPECFLVNPISLSEAALSHTPIVRLHICAYALYCLCTTLSAMNTILYCINGNKWCNPCNCSRDLAEEMGLMPGMMGDEV